MRIQFLTGRPATLVLALAIVAKRHSPRHPVSRHGWRVDITVEVLDTREYGGGQYSWGIHDDGDELSYLLADRCVTLKGTLRVSGGDNRALPTHSWK